MAQLPSFLPALFEAFGNQSADVRKVLMLLSALDDMCFYTINSFFFFFLGEVERTNGIKNFNHLSFLVFNVRK